MPDPLDDIYELVSGSKYNTSTGGGNPRDVGRRQSDILLDLDGMRAARAILDYGCGIGRTMPALYAGLANPQVVLDGCDISEDFLGECRRLYGRYMFRFYKIHADNSHYKNYNTTEAFDNLPQGFYDYAYSYSVFTHFNIAMAAKTLNFLNGILRTGGRYYFTMFRIDDQSKRVIEGNTSPAFKFEQAYREGSSEYFAIPSDELAFAAISQPAIEREIKAAGFKIVDYWDGTWRGLSVANIHDAYLIEKLWTAPKV